MAAEDFTPARRLAFADALAGLLNGSIAGPVVIQSVDPIAAAATRRRLTIVRSVTQSPVLVPGGRQRRAAAAPASRVTAQIPLPTGSCGPAEAALTPAAANASLTAAGFPVAGPIAVNFGGGCGAAVALPPALQQHADATTAVVAAVVAGVVAGSVAAAAAGAVGASLSTSAVALATPSPGASIYQLISAVQVHAPTARARPSEL